MKVNFDIAEDELPVFLAETAEQIQVLEDGLVRLEQGETEAELIQNLFRSAHSLKGAAGVIGHQRMVALTHALETILDGVRKGQSQIHSDLIDRCLQAVDGIQTLSAEVELGESSPVDVDALVSRLTSCRQEETAACEERPVALASQPAAGAVPVPGPNGASDEGALLVTAEISSESISPAARGLQLMLALQECGQIVQMDPGLDQIEAGQRFRLFSAELRTATPPEEIYRLLAAISEVEKLSVGPAGRSNGRSSGNGRYSNSSSRLVEPESDDHRRSAGDKTIRTSVERLDILMNLVGELITDRNRLYMVRRELEARFHGDAQVENLSGTVTHVGRITDQLQAEVMGIRMLPIASVINKFPRLVRDLARKANKQIELVVRGEDTELDRSVIEQINDPLIHLLRNAVDHGVEDPQARRAAGKAERGTILLTARHEQGRIILTVEDDGHGIDIQAVKNKAVDRGLLAGKDIAALTDEEAIELIFAPGLSTARMVSDISGRGVGMDIVRTNIERLNGTIQVETWPGQGTQFQIVLPLTLAIVPTLLVKVGRGIFAVPLVTILETLRVSEKEIQCVNRRPVIRLRDQVLPVVSLADVFGIHSPNGAAAGERSYKLIVVVRQGKSQAGLIVDQLVGEQEVVVKSLSTVVGEVNGISSAAILGDGQVALILDIQGILKLAAPH